MLPRRATPEGIDIDRGSSLQRIDSVEKHTLTIEAVERARKRTAGLLSLGVETIMRDSGWSVTRDSLPRLKGACSALYHHAFKYARPQRIIAHMHTQFQSCTEGSQDRYH